MQPKILGVMIEKGNSETTLAQKYGEQRYILLFTSRRKHGRSSGKIRITFWIALKEMFMVMKKRAPCTFWTPVLFCSVFQKSREANVAVRMVVIILT